MGNLLVRRARLVPVEPGASAPELPVDLLLADGAVREVGERLSRPAGVPAVDAGGRWLVPGLWDQHVHLGQWAMAVDRLDLTGTRSPEEVLATVARRLEEAPGVPVVGWGHRSGRWPREVTVAELDAVAGATPVVLIAGDGHHAWLSTTALDALALPRRDDVVREDEWFAAYPRLASVTGHDGATPAAYRRALGAAAALGVVGLVDFEFGGDPEAWVDRWGEGCDRLRVRAATYAEGLERVIRAGLRTGDPLLPGDDRLTMGPLKIISDGSLNTRTAWCHQPYAGGADHVGAPNLSPAELSDVVGRATRGGLRVATHAIGDAAVTAALDAYAATGARGSVEHAQLVTPGDIGRLAELGLVASVQPAHLLDDRDVTEQLWPERAERCFALRSMADRGVRLAFGSDAPVSPLDPWLAMAAAVHRSADDRPPWHPEQAITPRETLAASVDGQPTLGVGSRADLVLLDEDPLGHGSVGENDTVVAARRLRSMPVALTVVAGRVVHDAR